MIVTEEPVQNSSYKEDVNSTSGEALVTSPCVLYDATFSNDTAGVITCTLHNAASATAASKKVKAVVGANSVVHMSFPKGKVFTTKIFAKPNAAGLDIALDYD